VCSTASSWVGFNDSRSTGREYNSRDRPIPHQILPPQPVQEHFHSSRRLLDDDRFRCILEPESLYSFQKDQRFVATRVGEDRLAAGREQPRYEVGEAGSVLTLVEDVRGEDQVKGPKTRYVRFAPVERGDLRFQIQVRADVVGREVEGGLVVVRSKDFGALGEREYGGQSDAAPQLDNARTPKIAFGEVACQRDGTGP
jgi:hypothetical protein